MHETAVLIQLNELVRKTAADNGIEHVSRVIVSVGRISGLIPSFMHKYYDILTRDDPLLTGSELVVHMIPAEGICTECQTLYDIVRYQGICPSCGSRSRTVLRGKEFILDYIEA